MKNLVLILIAMVLFPLLNNAQTVTDIDGNVYHSVTIGSQEWMVENLRATRLNDSTIIPNVTDGKAWAALSTPGVCTYNNTTITDTIKAYGRLYNWYTVNTGKLCPIGWHVPSSDEFKTLMNYLGGNFCGNQLKEAGFAHWQTSPYDSLASNSTGFSALPGGYRDIIEPDDVLHPGKFVGMWQAALFWSFTAYDSQNAFLFGMTYLYNHVDVFYVPKVKGNSVRCLNDNDTYVGTQINDDLEIYPNPASEKLFIKNTPSNSYIYIYNLQGEKVIFLHNISDFIDISNLKKGIYMLKLFNSEKFCIKKFVKQ
jgi:uncharacterized protein (TIGR02145 family)